MEGLLLIDKPSGITSHKVVDIIRKKLNVRKVGHAGTLDPLATGLLIVMIGKATKLSNLLISQFKSYEVEMKLFLEDARDPIEYNPVFREYFIRLHNQPNIITFAYCP